MPHRRGAAQEGSQWCASEASHPWFDDAIGISCRVKRHQISCAADAALDLREISGPGVARFARTPLAILFLPLRGGVQIRASVAQRTPCGMPQTLLGNNMLDSAMLKPHDLLGSDPSAYALPRTETYPYARWPEPEGGIEVQFRLVYQGQLPAAKNQGRGTRTKEKHEIRRVLHKQLAMLWKTHPLLKVYLQAPRFVTTREIENGFMPSQRIDKVSQAERLAEQYERCGYRFVPLVGTIFQTACSIDILFLRRDEPGHLVSGGGDIDNRIKTLFDALRMPQRCDELKGFSPGDDENPFFVLLEDDQLITEVKVTTDRLLTPLAGDEHVNDVHLIIHVRTLLVGASLTSDWTGVAAFLT